jgi:hypothetical protein
VYLFLASKIHHLVAKTVNLVKMASCESWLTLLASPISAIYQAILTQKNTLVGIECKLSINITRFTLSTFSELLAALISAIDHGLAAQIADFGQKALQCDSATPGAKKGHFC